MLPGHIFATPCSGMKRGRAAPAPTDPTPPAVCNPFGFKVRRVRDPGGEGSVRIPYKRKARDPQPGPGLWLRSLAVSTHQEEPGAREKQREQSEHRERERRNDRRR